MTDTPETPQPAPPETAAPSPGQDEQAVPPIVINGQYIKDLSFEAPSAPGVFAAMQQEPPEITINVDVNARPLAEKAFEVILHVQAECKTKDTSAFILEVAYGGLFTINVPEEHLQPVLLIECPRLLFPFVRHILSVITRDAGFPPLLLGPVDFVAMYQNSLQKEGETAESAVT